MRMDGRAHARVRLASYGIRMGWSRCVACVGVILYSWIFGVWPRPRLSRGNEMYESRAESWVITLAPKNHGRFMKLALLLHVLLGETSAFCPRIQSGSGAHESTTIAEFDDT